MILHIRTLMAFAFSLMFLLLTACASENPSSSQTTEVPDPMSLKGVGPVRNIILPEEINPAIVSSGKSVFESKCAVCHRFDSKLIGPPVGGVTLRRTPEWIMNMILNPEEMAQKDPLARQLRNEYNAQMIYQGVTEQEARAILEYFRDYDSRN